MNLKDMLSTPKRLIKQILRFSSGTMRKDLDPLKAYAEQKEFAFWKLYKVLEYKLYEMNANANTLLYQNELELSRMKRPAKETFCPKVSIVMPAYNGSNYLNQAIDSALAQTYKNIEIIVVNDGSNDNNATENIALSYGNKVRYFKKENGGVSSALNFGIQNMTGEYFAWLSHDDLYYPCHIEEHIKYLSSTSETNVITYSNFNFIDGASRLLIEDTIIAGIHCFDYKMTKLKPEYALLQGEINGGSVLIPKSAFQEVGVFDESLRISQERDMWSRMLKKYKFFNIPITTSAIRVHAKQVSQTDNRILIETNQKRMQIIDDLSIETMKRLEGSEYNFYIVMKNYYSNNGLREMVGYIDRKIEEVSRMK